MGKKMMWYHPNEIYEFRKNIDTVIQFQKYLSDDFHLRIDLGYLFSKKRQKKRWCIMTFVLEEQKTLTPDNLALFYARMSRKEREDGIDRASLLSKMINTHDLSGFLSSSLSNPKENLNKFGKRPRTSNGNDHDSKLLKAL